MKDLYKYKASFEVGVHLLKSCHSSHIFSSRDKKKVGKYVLRHIALLFLSYVHGIQSTLSLHYFPLAILTTFWLTLNPTTIYDAMDFPFCCKVTKTEILLASYRKAMTFVWYKKHRGWRRKFRGKLSSLNFRMFELQAELRENIYFPSNTNMLKCRIWKCKGNFNWALVLKKCTLHWSSLTKEY